MGRPCVECNHTGTARVGGINEARRPATTGSGNGTLPVVADDLADVRPKH